jgi:hypothetical protein
MKFLNYRTIGWRGMNSPHPSQEQEEHNSKNGLGRGRKKGLKRPGEFSPGSSHQPGLEGHL